MPLLFGGNKPCSVTIQEQQSSSFYDASPSRQSSKLSKVDYGCSRRYQDFEASQSAKLKVHTEQELKDLSAASHFWRATVHSAAHRTWHAAAAAHLSPSHPLVHASPVDLQHQLYAYGEAEHGLRQGQAVCTLARHFPEVSAKYPCAIAASSMHERGRSALSLTESTGSRPASACHRLSGMLRSALLQPQPAVTKHA